MIGRLASKVTPVPNPVKLSSSESVSIKPQVATIIRIQNISLGQFLLGNSAVTPSGNS